MPSRHKLAIFGDSNLGAVRRAWEAGLLRFHGYDLEFWGAAGGDYRAIHYGKGALRATTLEAEETVLLVNGNGRRALAATDFDVFVFYGVRLRLAEFFAASSGPVRPVGAGHSFSPLVPTDGHLVVLDRLSGLLSHDPVALQATFGAGTRLGDMGAPLEAVGQAMLNRPESDRQTLAGATATATHGTGIGFTCLSAYVQQLQLVTPRGEVLEIGPGHELFDAARVSLGALGVVTRMTLQNRTPYRLKARNWVAPIEEVLAQFAAQAARQQCTADHRQHGAEVADHCQRPVLWITAVNVPVATTHGAAGRATECARCIQQ